MLSDATGTDGLGLAAGTLATTAVWAAVIGVKRYRPFATAFLTVLVLLAGFGAISGGFGGWDVDMAIGMVAISLAWGLVTGVLGALLQQVLRRE